MKKKGIRQLLSHTMSWDLGKTGWEPTLRTKFLFGSTFFDQTYFSFAKIKRVYEPKFRPRPKPNVRGNENFVPNVVPKKEQTKISFRAAFQNERKPKKGLKSSFDETNGICV